MNTRQVAGSIFLGAALGMACGSIFSFVLRVPKQFGEIAGVLFIVLFVGGVLLLLPRR